MPVLPGYFNYCAPSIYILYFTILWLNSLTAEFICALSYGLTKSSIFFPKAFCVKADE